MVYRYLVFSFLNIMLASFAGAQSTKISKDQYFSNLEQATKVTDRMFPRRSIRVEEEFKDEKKISKKTSTYEYVAADRNRRLVEVTAGDGMRSEYIRLGQHYYCKEGSSKWKKSGTPCEPMNMSMSPDPDAEQFTLEKVTETAGQRKVFRWYKTWTYPKTSAGIEFYNEQIFEIGPDGAFSRIVLKHGKTMGKGPDGIQMESFEYHIAGLKIEPPIK